MISQTTFFVQRFNVFSFSPQNAILKFFYSCDERFYIYGSHGDWFAAFIGNGSRQHIFDIFIRRSGTFWCILHQVLVRI